MITLMDDGTFELHTSDSPFIHISCHDLPLFPLVEPYLLSEIPLQQMATLQLHFGPKTPYPTYPAILNFSRR